MVKTNINLDTLLQILDVENYYSNDNKYNYTSICTIDTMKDSCIIFIKSIKEDNIEKINAFSNILVVTETYVDLHNKSVSMVIVKNARLAMAKLLGYIQKSIDINISNSNSYISKNAIISSNVIIEDNVFIGDNVEIGENSIIKYGAKIIGNVKIGSNVKVRENSVVGGQGFGVEKDNAGNNYKIPHLGGVIIGDNVEIGALNTIVSGTINPTIIGDYTKIDDHVHIAHNCKIEKNCIITAGVVLSGSVTLGENVWVGPNSTIKNSISVSSGVLIGIGSVVTKNIEQEGITVAGNPAKEFNEFIKDKKDLSYLLSNIDKIKDLI